MKSDLPTMPNYALHKFILSRFPFSAKTWEDERRKMFSCGFDAAILGGPWDLLRVRKIENSADNSIDVDDENTSDIDRELTERRILHALGPIDCTAEFSDFSGTFESIAKQYVFLAYVEVRIGHWPFEQTVDSEASIIRATAKALRVKLSSIPGEFAIFECLGHSDLILLFCGNCISDISRMFLNVRKLHMGDVWKADPTLQSTPLDEKYAERHIVEGTLTSFGFFCESVDQLAHMDKRLQTMQGPNYASMKCDTPPTVLCALRPGHESTLEEVRDKLLLPTSPEDRHGRIQVITGIYDLRLSYVFDRDHAPTEAEVFGWVTRLYHRIFHQPTLEPSTAHGDRQHIRNIHTSWGYDPSLTNPEKPLHDDKHEDKHERAPLPDPEKLAVRDVFQKLNPNSFEALKIHTKTLNNIIERYDSAALSPLLARYLADLHSFLMSFRDALLDDLKIEPPKQPISRYDVELLLRRLTFVFVGRLSGAAPHGESDLTFGAGMTRQKVALALNCVAEEIREALGSGQSGGTEDGSGNLHLNPAILVGFSIVGRARTTRWHWDANPQMVLIELPVTNDLHTPLFSVIHEVANVVQLRGLDVPGVQGLLIDRLLTVLASHLHAQDSLRKIALEGNSWDYHEIKQQLATTFEVLVGLKRPGVDSRATSDKVRHALNQFTTAQGIAKLLAHSHIIHDAIDFGIFDDLCRIADRVRDEMDLFKRTFARARADIIAAHLCGWRPYLDFLLAENEPEEESLTMRTLVLYHVGIQCADFAYNEQVKLPAMFSSAHLEFLVDFAKATKVLVDAESKTRLARTYRLCRELENAKNTFTMDVSLRLFQAWVGGWLEPMKRHRKHARSLPREARS